MDPLEMAGNKPQSSIILIVGLVILLAIVLFFSIVVMVLPHPINPTAEPTFTLESTEITPTSNEFIYEATLPLSYTPTLTPTFTITLTPILFPSITEFPITTPTYTPTPTPTSTPTYTPTPTPLPPMPTPLPPMPALPNLNKCAAGVQSILGPADGKVFNDGDEWLILQGTANWSGEGTKAFWKYEIFYYDPSGIKRDLGAMESVVVNGELYKWHFESATLEFGPGWYIVGIKVVMGDGNNVEIGEHTGCHIRVYLPSPH